GPPSPSAAPLISLSRDAKCRAVASLAGTPLLASAAELGTLWSMTQRATSGSPSVDHASAGSQEHARWVAPLCWSSVALEGFDLVVLGVVLPSLLRYSPWGLDPNTATLIVTIGLVGVMV